MEQRNNISENQLVNSQIELQLRLAENEELVDKVMEVLFKDFRNIYEMSADSVLGFDEHEEDVLKKYRENLARFKEICITFGEGLEQIENHTKKCFEDFGIKRV